MYSHYIPIIPSRETVGGKRDRQDKRVCGVNRHQGWRGEASKSLRRNSDELAEPCKSKRGRNAPCH